MLLEMVSPGFSDDKYFDIIVPHGKTKKSNRTKVKRVLIKEFSLNWFHKYNS